MLSHVSDSPLILVRAHGAGVLGEYDHVVELPASQEFAIIYGPNGVGKTKFLEIIKATSSIDGRSLSQLPFTSMDLGYSNGSVLRATRLLMGEADAARNAPHIRFELIDPDGHIQSWEFKRDDFQEWLIENTAWRPMNAELREDLSDGEIASLADLESRFPAPSPSKKNLPEFLHEFARRATTYLIETQRLRIEQRAISRRNQAWPPSHSKSSSRISQQAATMRSLINDAQTEHSRITQQLDRTFPHRVLSSSGAGNRRDADIRERYNQQNEFRSRLGRVASVTLEDALSLPDRELLEWEQQLLTLYLEDADKKLAPFETLLQKIELLEEIVGNRLLNKRLQVTAAEGLTVTHTHPERRLDLDSLSSGEQHEIILMFDLLFNVPEGAIVMIDEPEISLHVVWQLGFIPDVQRIAELAGFRFLVATHSPQIINDAWDRAVRLGPPEAQFS